MPKLVLYCQKRNILTGGIYDIVTKKFSNITFFDTCSIDFYSRVVIA